MEPNDPKLRDLLREWQAPPTPASLDRRVLSLRPSLWRFLLSTKVSVPIPVACTLAFLLLFTGWWLARQTTPKAPCVTASAIICTTCRT
jgi:hypothetical protein